MPASAVAEPQHFLDQQTRWRAIEIAFWIATLLPFVLFPNYLQLASQIAITALFALSLDLILGYAGIVSLGHAAFFASPPYTAGLIAKWGEPLSGPDRRLGGRTARLRHQLHHRPLPAPRFDHDHARARPAARRGRQQRELADRRRRRPAGRADVEAPRPVRVRSLRSRRLRLFARRPVPDVPGGAAADQLVRSGAARNPRECHPHARDRGAEPGVHSQSVHHRRGHGRH